MSSPARALERVTLRNGVTMDCTRHENLGDQVRLYAGHSKAYQDVSFLQIVSIDYVPDTLATPPPKPVLTQHPILLANTRTPPALPAPKPAASYVSPKPVIPALTATVTAMQPGFPGIEVRDLLQRAGSTYNIDVELLASIIHAESGGNAGATSRYGARGLMQLMPSVGRTYGANDLYRPDQNVTAGTAFLDALLRKYNDNLPLALAAYNAGPGAVERYHGVPPSARGYVGRVISEFYRRKLALGPKPNATAPVQAAKSMELAWAGPPPVMRAAPTKQRTRGSSIHREWSGQRSFAKR